MYVQWRMRSLQRRATKKGCAVHLRSFLRYLHASGRARDRPEEIKQVLRSTRQDRSPIGLRDFAILTLLSTYGLPVGEITALRLDDACIGLPI